MIEKNAFYIDGVLQDDVLYFTILEPNLLMNIAPKLDEIIHGYLKQKKYNYIVIDLSNVTRIDSAGYGMIIGLITYFPQAEMVNIFIINMSAMIKKIIELIGFPLVMYTYPALEGAVEKIRELKQA
jgi:anti-anti-sigma factor